MTGRGFGRCLAIAAALFLAACSAPHLVTSAEPAEGRAQPNIIFITAEDLSPRFGFMGDPVAVTPNIDALALEGVWFSRAFTTSGVCAPSRSALITGVHQQTLGTMNMRTRDYARQPGGFAYDAVPPPEVKAFPELLRRAGYHAINRQKTDYQFGEPFSVWDDDSRGKDLPNLADRQPFFAMVNHEVTHESVTWPPDTDPSLNPAVANVVKRNAKIDEEKRFPLTDPAKVRVPAYYPDTPVVRANIARQYDNTRLMDEQVGRLLARLKADGRFEDSIIVFTTDHGDGLPRAKRTIFDSGTQVPLIVRFPDGRFAGTRRDDLVSFVDLAPTFLAWAGAPIPDWIQGRNLFADPAPDAIYMAGDRFDEVPQRFRGVREERWHYIRYFSDEPVIPSLGYQNVNPIMREMRRLADEGGLTPLQASYLDGPAPRELLFDTAADPDEVNNLAKVPRFETVRRRMAGKLDRWIERTGDLGRMDEADMVAAMWPGGKQPKTARVAACRQQGGAIRLSSATKGASIGWNGENGQRDLYVSPVSATRAFVSRAIRYGYAPSDPVTIDPSAAPPC